MRAVMYVFILFIAGAFVMDALARTSPTEICETAKNLIVEGNNQFALELYAKLSKREGNLFFSPYSISTALAMTYAGARGQTESQMAEVLHFPNVSKGQKASQENFHEAFGAIIDDLNNRGGKGVYQMTVANALWPQKGYGLSEEYIGLIIACYGGNLHPLDYVTAAEQARLEINSWVEDKTNNKIKDLIPRGVLGELTRLVLTNAIYFKGNWANQFKPENTKDEPFTLINGKKVDVPMMTKKFEFGYTETEDAQILQMPYVKEELSMIILLPKNTGGIGRLEDNFTGENISAWLKAVQTQEVIVFLPKFEMTAQFELAGVLQSMGMTDAFSFSTADFSGINGHRDLVISNVIHKAYVKVDEEGTEAAAATAVVAGITAVQPKETPVFRADHPFIFLIRDNKSSSILFIGRVLEPRL